MIPAERLREIATKAWALDDQIDVPNWMECEPIAAELLAARAEIERLRDDRDALLAAVMDGTAEFRKWQECVADKIEGQESEVCRDHNWMLAALRTIRRKAEHVQSGTRAIVEAGSLPAHLDRAEQPKPAGGAS